MKPVAGGRAFRAGAAKEADGEGPAGGGRREARPARGWNYNQVEVRGAGPEKIYSSNISGADSPPVTPSNSPQLSPPWLVT